MSPRFHLAIIIPLILLISDQAVPAADKPVDFEGMTPDLPGWSCTTNLTADKGKAEYRVAAKWDIPFTIVLDPNRPHSGATSLKWECNQAFAGTVNVRPPNFPVPGGTEVVVQFYTRSEGPMGTASMSVDEMKTEKERVKLYYQAAQIPLSAEWVKVEWRGVLDPSTTQLRVCFKTLDPQPGGRIWLDDISVAPAVADYK